MLTSAHHPEIRWAKTRLDGTITSKAKAPVPRKHQSETVATPTESGVLSCPNSAASHVQPVAVLYGFGRGALIRKDSGTASDVFSTPRPPYAQENAAGGFLTPEGERAMQPNDTTTKTQVATQAFAFLARTGRFAPIDAGLDPADFTDNDHAEFKRMALQQEAFNALARAQRELLASRSDYPNAVAQAERAIAAMTALALLDGSAA